ncbi:hypothetical protein C8R46DRAFT_1231968 [Mycena filopes]|nr:hypothetical protein C8R46DRAFT_1231968 [Mycena filopes]
MQIDLGHCPEHVAAPSCGVQRSPDDICFELVQKRPFWLVSIFSVDELSADLWPERSPDHICFELVQKRPFWLVSIFRVDELWVDLWPEVY